MSEHTHIDKSGILHKCYHECKDTVLNWKFVVGITLSWPLEHALYQYVWPFKLVSKFLGIGD